MTIIPAYPYNIVNGINADANQVMADFNNVLNSVNTNGAHNGSNSDITAISGLTTPLSPFQGGTGLSSPGGVGNILQSNGSLWVSVAPYLGVTDGSSAAPGYIGEIQTASGSAAIGGAYASIANFTLSPGDWDVCGGVALSSISSGTPTNIQCFVNNTPSAPPSAVLGYAVLVVAAGVGAGTILQTTPVRFAFSVPTAIYLGGFSGGGVSNFNGNLRARRVR